MPHCDVGVPESSDTDLPALDGQSGMSAGAHAVSAIEQFVNSAVTAQAMFPEGVTKVTVPVPGKTIVAPDEVGVVTDSVEAVVVTVFVTVDDFSTITVVSLPQPAINAMTTTTPVTRPSCITPSLLRPGLTRH
jgi:hypothetical protein